jgi:ribosomal protein L7Ae-like RNA K-turn-binding protein
MSAIDPVKSIRAEQEPVDVAVNLGGILRRLAELPPSPEAPYLTVCLDWRPDGANPQRRPVRDDFEQQAAKLLDGPQGRSAATESLRADVARISAYLDEQDGASAQGLAVVACHAAGVFEAVPLGLPIDDEVAVGPTPSLVPLVRAAEDHPTYAVVLADQRQATLSIVTQGRRQRRVEVAGTGYPVRQSQGGWSQRRYQDRADERIEHFLGAVAEETRKALDEGKVGMLVLAGDDQITTQLRDTLHPSIRERIVGHVNLSIRAGRQEVIDATLPLVDAAERARERDAVTRVRDNAASGGAGVIGVEDVLTALQAGQVLTLVITEDFSAEGWADYGLPLWGVGEVPDRHPAGGDAADLVPVMLESELVRLALQSDAEIEVVMADVPVSAEELADVPQAEDGRPRSATALELDALGGVGAVLRFALDAGQPTAEL